MDNNKEKLIHALISKPSIYEITVLDGSMLPDKLKDSEFISFEIKPPTMEVLAKCTIPMFKIPEEVRESKNLKLEEAIKYRHEIVEVLAILAHGSESGDYPKWHIRFLLTNLDPEQSYLIFYESSLKFKQDFFLSSFQIAKNNPMMMNQ